MTYRCSICDFVPNIGSPHLEDPAPGATELLFDDTRGLWHCSHCASAIQENLQDITPYEDEYVSLADYLRDYEPLEEEEEVEPETEEGN